ncbi:MAG: diaminopimelate epimerase [Candidatus Euphemobacter frigidus]|nr:diaminopimelate epimerase [Candidatus Euphemobacter frigidus]MDP8274873.1 diaminopimelate epimerase [Candidatus Euphemobacter frigidus]
MKIEFTKMQGLGNDFILIDDSEGDLALQPEQVRFLCDRHFGIGADGIITVGPSTRADLKMRIFNPDGSEPEMCGNGIRCLALYARQRGLVTEEEIRVETRAGIMRPRIKDDLIVVDMGEPELSGPLIPVNLPGKVIDHPVKFGGTAFSITCVSMGNPHCVLFFPPDQTLPVEELGPVIETDKLFPGKTNVEFVQVIDREEINLSVWERGAGRTLACGTGACAAVVAGVLNNKMGRRVLVHLPGGDLRVEWESDNHLFLAGPVAFVFTGEVDVWGISKWNKW